MKNIQLLRPSGGLLAAISCMLLLMAPIANQHISAVAAVAACKHWYKLKFEPKAVSIYTKPYVINNKRYYPQSHYNYDQVGLASWYGPGFHKRLTATGEVFNMHNVSGASKTLPLPCVVRVTNLENGKYIDVKLTDRGPFMRNAKEDQTRIIDLSHGAAKKLGFVHKGLAQVRVQCLVKESLEVRQKFSRKKRGRAANV